MSVLVSRTEIDIIACERVAAGQEDRICGVRWGTLPELGFPDGGYHLYRIWDPSGGGTTTTDLGVRWLPATDTWSAFYADAVARQPDRGPYFSSILESDFSYILPIIRLADPRTPLVERVGLMLTVAEFFGHTHQTNPQLAWKYWRTSSAPAITALAALPFAARDLVLFYQQQCVSFLLALAVRFEFAALLGLGSDEARPGSGNVVFRVEASWADGTSGSSESDLLYTNAPCSCASPISLSAETVPGTVGHPAFEHLTGWSLPTALAPTDPSGEPLPDSAAIPRVPALYTALRWTDPPVVISAASSISPQDLLGYGPVTYRVLRYEYGAETAGLAAMPALPSGAVFVEVSPGELVARTKASPQYLDGPGRPWPPLRGWYQYEVRGVSLLGCEAGSGPQAGVLHADTIAPVPPRVRITSDVTTTVTGGGDTVSVDLRLDWDVAEDFLSPDANDFRVAAWWEPSLVVPVHIESVGTPDELTFSATVTSLAVPDDTYAGCRLSAGGRDFLIAHHTGGAPASVTLYKVNGATAAANQDGAIFARDAGTAIERVDRLARNPAVPVWISAVTVSSTSPTVRLGFTSADGSALPSDTSLRIYVHLLRSCLDLEQLSPTEWWLKEPSEDHPAADEWARWMALADPEVELTGSSAILYPGHTLTVAVTAPLDFVAGLLRLAVTAADDATYVNSPALPSADPALLALTGNESAAAEALLPVRSTAQPSGPTVPTYDSGVITWATSATRYDEFARYEVSWSAVTGATRYEVWRALEGAVSGVTSGTSDPDLRTAAAADPSAFSLRTGGAFTTSWTDEIPGRAPTRVLYRVRAINAAGTAGAFSDVIGPVHVPDIRIPPAPSLLSVRAVDPSTTDRAIRLEWSQAGSLTGVRFDVYAQAEGEDGFSLLTSIASGTAPSPGNRFSATAEDLVPGRQYTMRVVAVREALDPIDPTGATTRDLASLPSASRSAVAVSAAPMAAPSDVAAAALSSSEVSLSWTNGDTYRTIEVHRRNSDEYQFRRVTSLSGSATGWEDTGLSTGTYIWRIRALGYSRMAEADSDEVTLS